MTDGGNLNNLHDIVMQPPPGWFPFAAGVWLLLGFVLVVICLLCLRLYIKWRANAYRRAGLALLANAQTNDDVSVILKRVALAVWPRTEVASLYGTVWSTFLNTTCLQRDFSLFGDSVVSEVSSASFTRRIDLARVWIKYHQVTETHGKEKM